MPSEYYSIPYIADIQSIIRELNRVFDSISRRLNYINPDGDNITLSNRRITNLADAIDDYDAINRTQAFVRGDSVIPSRLLQTNTSNELDSVLDLTDYISGTSNRILVTDDTDGTVTLSTPQDIATTSTPTFVGARATSDFLLYTGASKTLYLQTPVYNDIQFPISGGKVPAVGAPTFETFTTNTNEYSFAVNDYIDLVSNELIHSWLEGTAGDLHIHISTKAANTSGANRFAKFTAYVAYAKGNTTWTETSISAELTIPNGTAALTLFYLDIGDVAFTGLTIGSQVKIRLKRIAATGGTEYASSIFINQVGMHIQEDTIGSRQEGVK